MKLNLKLAVSLAVVILSFWSCGYFLLPTTPSSSDPPRSELGLSVPSVPVAIPIAEVILETNNQRRINGLGLLAENQNLNNAADFKMRDMFARQYFDHYGPDHSSGVHELLTRFSYKYIAAGENLALGDFKNASDLVAAWMTSPGHRANILSGVYREIGVTTGYDFFQGRRTIIAVQIFGTRG